MLLLLLNAAVAAGAAAAAAECLFITFYHVLVAQLSLESHQEGPSRECPLEPWHAALGSEAVG